MNPTGNEYHDRTDSDQGRLRRAGHKRELAWLIEGSWAMAPQERQTFKTRSQKSPKLGKLWLLLQIRPPSTAPD